MSRSRLRSRITQVSGSCIIDVRVYVEDLWFRVSSSQEREPKLGFSKWRSLEHIGRNSLNRLAEDESLCLD